MEIAAVIESPESEFVGTIRPGRVSGQTLLGDQAADGLDFEFGYSHYGTGEDTFSSPRHHHSFQQIRWAVSGNVNFGPGQDIPEGDVAYFPRGTYYGPQRQEKGAMMILQFGFEGEHIGGKNSIRGAHQVLATLVERGARLENGLLIDADPVTGAVRERDSVFAVYEELTDIPYVIPDEGYESPILMHTDAFSYYQCGPGVEAKHLGAFFDHPGANADVRLGMLRLSANATYQLGSERAQLVWSLGPGLEVDKQVHPKFTAVYSALGEQLEISVRSSVELATVEFPRLG